MDRSTLSLRPALAGAAALVFAASALALLAPRTAIAASSRDEARARAHWERGAELYEAGDPEGAIKEWEDGYTLSERPEFLLNIAQAYRGLRDESHAIYYYRLYLKRKPDAADAKEVREIIAELERDGADAIGGEGSDDDGPVKPTRRTKGPVTYDDEGRPVDDPDGRDRGARRPPGDDGDPDGYDGDYDGRRSDDPEEARARRELGSSYDAWYRSGLTIEGFRRVRVGSTLMVVGGVLMGGGVALLVLGAYDDPMTRTPLETLSITGGAIALVGGAYVLYFGYAAWARGGKDTRGSPRAFAPTSVGLGFAPLRGGAALTLSGRF